MSVSIHIEYSLLSVRLRKGIRLRRSAGNRTPDWRGEALLPFLCPMTRRSKRPEDIAQSIRASYRSLESPRPRYSFRMYPPISMPVLLAASCVKIPPVPINIFSSYKPKNALSGWDTMHSTPHPLWKPFLHNLCRRRPHAGAGLPDGSPCKHSSHRN